LLAVKIDRRKPRTAAAPRREDAAVPGRAAPFDAPAPPQLDWETLQRLIDDATPRVRFIDDDAR
jgi:hypothetical protein